MIKLFMQKLRGGGGRGQCGDVISCAAENLTQACRARGLRAFVCGEKGGRGNQ